MSLSSQHPMVHRESGQGSHSEVHGPHGGRLIAVQGGFVEISVFEANVPPRFHLYFFDERQQAVAAPPGAVEIETLRPDGERQTFTFRLGDGFLESTSEIPEPHDFHVALALGANAARRMYGTRFTEEGHAYEEGHGHGEHAHGGHGRAAGHGHTHGIVDPTIRTTARGLWAIKWSFVALFVTALIQLAVVMLSNSVALLTDMIHNFGDAATAIPLGVAFLFARRSPSRSSASWGTRRSRSSASGSAIRSAARRSSPTVTTRAPTDGRAWPCSSGPWGSTSAIPWRTRSPGSSSRWRSSAWSGDP